MVSRPLILYAYHAIWDILCNSNLASGKNWSVLLFDDW